MKKTVKEARIPLQPGEEAILRQYPTVMPAMRQTLDFLRQKQPNISLSQAAQQLLSTPNFQGNQQLAAISKLRPQDVQSSAAVGQLFSKNPVVKPPPANIMQYNPIVDAVKKNYNYDPVEYSQTIEQERSRQDTPEQKAKQRADLAAISQRQALDAMDMQKINKENPVSGPPGMRSPEKQKGRVSPPPGSTVQKQMQNQNQRQNQVNPYDKTMMQQNEAFNFSSLTASLQKIMKVITTLRPEELQMLLKMLNQMTGGQPQAMNSVGQTSMVGTTMTSSQKYDNRKLVEAFKKDILKEELIASIKQQSTNGKLVENLLSEGPFSNVWQGIKDAGTSVMNKLSGNDKINAIIGGKATPEDQAKQYSGELMKIIKKAHQTRQQFKQQVLKNAEIINSYHDSVAAAHEMFSHVANMLGPHSGALKSQVDELVSNLKYDLESEKEQIHSFLKVLGGLRGAVDSDLARANAEFQRDQEAQEARRMKNPITGKRMADSAVDPEIIKDTDKDLVDSLVKRSIKGDKKALEQLRDIQFNKALQMKKAEKAKAASK